MPRILFGNSWEAFEHAPLDGMKALAGMGLSFIRVWIFWDSAEPNPADFKWSKVEADIQAIRGAGMKVYANLLWAPTHASNQAPTYLPYTRGCTAWVDPRDGSKGIRFAAEHPYCSVPEHIDPAAAHRFGAALASKFGDEISWYSAWNEPGQSFYWPAILFDHWDVAIARLLDEVIIPFTNGVRSVKPNATFVGPEADHEAVIRETLKQESERGLKLFDVVTFHPYAWGPFPSNSYRRIDEGFVPAAAQHRNGRKLWYSETGDDGTGKIVEWAENAVQRDVAAINFHDFKQWFQPGTWENRTYVPNTKYEDMKKLIRRVNRRRRPIGTHGPDEPRLAIREEAREMPEWKAVAHLNEWRHKLLSGY